MIWENPGNELKQTAEESVAKYRGRRLYIYGAGLVGTRVVRSILHLTDWTVAGMIDRDTKKQGTLVNGVKVFSLQEILAGEALDSCQIIMGLTGSAGLAVKKEIDCVLQEKDSAIRCIPYETFMGKEFPAIASCCYNKIFVNSLSLIVTERCTLRCRKCAIMLPYFKNSVTYPLDTLKQSVDLAFQKIDFIGDFTITGGEPLLHDQLNQILVHLGKRYRDRVGSFKIITNGTVTPSRELLNSMRTYCVDAEVSDYTKAVEAIRAKVESTVAAFRQNGIDCHFLSASQWVDFGFDMPGKGWDDGRLAAFFDYCSTTCRGYVDGEIWYCVNAGFAEKALGKAADPENRLDLRKVGDSLEERRAIVEFDMGYNRRGYLNMCQNCNGSCEINTNYIEVGEQWIDR